MNDFASMREVTERGRGRVDVLGAPLRRRSYSRAEKARLVAETLQPGTRTADVGRRHGIHPQVVYAWQRLARQGELALQAIDVPMFAAVLAAPEPTPCRGASETDGGITIEFWDIRLVVGADVSPERSCGACRGPAAEMILPSGPVRVYVATKPVDFRKGIDGLAALAEAELRLDPFSGVVLVFRAKRADRIKILVWDGSGMVLIAKRLEGGKFAWPAMTDGVMKLSPAQLSALFEGLDWRRVHARRVRRPVTAG